LLLLAVSASLLWLFVVLVLSILLHEVGHAVAAWTGGYRVTSFGVGSGKPLLLLRLPGSGTIFYLCRFGPRFSGITWVFFPGGAPSSLSNLLLACGGALANGIAAGFAALVLASWELRSVPFLSVWVPIVVVLLVNSVLMLLFFVPRRTLSAEHGTLTSDSLQALAALFPGRFRSRQSRQGRGASADTSAKTSLLGKYQGHHDAVRRTDPGCRCL
jgi:membrane-associated protease RseP (regulator of RpoE activity)